MPKSRLTSIRTLLDQKNDKARRREEDVPKREAVCCSWCERTAMEDVQVAGQPVCESHRREIEAEMKVSGGRTVTATKAEREARREGTRRLMKSEAEWQAAQPWRGR